MNISDIHKKVKFSAMAAVMELLIIGAIALACTFSNVLFYLFYNLIYGLLFSVLIPFLYVQRKREDLKSLGIVPLGTKQVIIVVVFWILSIGGQAIPLVIEGIGLQWNYLFVGFIPLVMTTFFEELLFRGFLQTRFESLFGAVPGIVFSGLFFSLYHLGYPGFRSVGDMALLFAVGAGFALAYKLSGNNLAVSYLVNLPNALLTYLLKYKQFPTFDTYSTVFALISIAAICIILLMGVKRIKSNAK